MSETLFFELLQVALGRRERISSTPTEREWTELFEMSQKQAVAGVAFYALEKLGQADQKPQLSLLYNWIGLSGKIRQKNQLLNKRCLQLQQRLKEKGYASSILKGQGIALYYDEPLQELRQPGDIDIYVDCGREKAIQLAHEFGQEHVEWDYKHLHLDIWKDTEVEMHYRVEVLLNLQKNTKLQKWFQTHTEELFGHTNPIESNIGRCAQNLNKNELIINTAPKEISKLNQKYKANVEPKEQQEDCELVTPSVEFNVFYILLHIYRHFLYEGVGMRQLMDYYFVLKSLTPYPSPKSEGSLKGKKNDIQNVLKEFGMWKFARGVMWVMQRVFGLEKDCLICEPLEEEGRFILSEVMEGGNFGHYDERLSSARGGKLQTMKKVVKHNVHLMRHYPSEIIWPPIWFVWHKCWKWTK